MYEAPLMSRGPPGWHRRISWTCCSRETTWRSAALEDTESMHWLLAPKFDELRPPTETAARWEGAGQGNGS